MPAKDYALLTGLDTDTLPVMEVSDTVTSIAQVEESEEEKQNSPGISSASETGSAWALATISLEEEISVDRLPL